MYNLIVTTKFISGAYMTATIKGKKASSTLSARAAVERLTAKLFPAETVYVHAFKQPMNKFLITTEQLPCCKHCEGWGEIEFPNISGHDYSEACSQCKGTGVTADG